MTTERQRRGSVAEAQAADYLVGLGWRVVGRNVKIGRDEIDILAIDPGPPSALVFVEVRSASSPVFGTPEERVDRAKVSHLYRASRVLGEPAHLPRRVDLVVVDRRSGKSIVRHLRALEPP
ncbi:MAG TPA: YraN family protein [Candidatus Limnocylindrales bacterium]|nr:YraN family protein [Candidatus Limnocylindrales bacterium]